MNNKKRKIGIIAGRGDYPLLLIKEALKNNIQEIVTIGFHEHINCELMNISTHFEVMYLGQIKKIAKTLQKYGIKEVILCGQIKPSNLFKKIRLDFSCLRLLAKLKEKNAQTIFKAFCDYLLKFNIKVLKASIYMDDYLAKQGVIGKVKISKNQQEDLNYAFKVAKEISTLDIGQTCVIKKGTILAIEGFDGTDSTIIRGGKLGYGGVTVAKVSKKNHDMRFDIPCIGIRTIKSLIQARAKNLVIEAGKTLLLEKNEILSLCDKHKICIIGY